MSLNSFNLDESKNFLFGKALYDILCTQESISVPIFPPFCMLGVTPLPAPPFP